MSNTRKTIKLKYGNRVETFSVDPGVHTLSFDMRTIEAEIIKKFLELLREKMGNSSAATAIAIGWFNVPVGELFDENFAHSEFDLDDVTLAKIVRLRQERKELEEKSS